MDAQSSSPFYRRLFVVLLVGFALAAIFVLGNQTLGFFQTAPAVGGLLLIVVTNAAVLLGLLSQAERHQLKLDRAGNISLSKALLFVLVLGLAVGLLFAASGTQLHLFPLEASVTGLGIATVVFTVVLAILLWTLKQAGFFVSPSSTDGPQLLVHLVPDEEAEHILTIEGIGPKYASRLNAHGIITIPQLRDADPLHLAQAGRATKEFAEEWQAMARFMDVKGIGPQFAEVLARAGLRTVGELAAADKDELSKRIMDMEASRKVRIQGTDVTPGVAGRWIKAAQQYIGFTS